MAGLCEGGNEPAGSLKVISQTVPRIGAETTQLPPEAVVPVSLRKPQECLVNRDVGPPCSPDTFTGPWKLFTSSPTFDRKSRGTTVFDVPYATDLLRRQNKSFEDA
ncbi:hypothetical protein ANN_25751 [Periplaneta americana]|uniref:Uncharacterized protein n=1 Tax=Periplaneta americana TaxID=6978 RepID=A0ABQ8S410_PERAM|nr:hypothetical protein ANN_25751 [Periplaneta americana]